MGHKSKGLGPVQIILVFMTKIVRRKGMVLFPGNPTIPCLITQCLLYIYHLSCLLYIIFIMYIIYPILLSHVSSQINGILGEIPILPSFNSINSLISSLKL